MNESPKFNYNILFSIFIYFCSGAFLVASFFIDEPDSTFFPRIVIAISIILATLFLISTLKGHQDYEENTFAGTKRAMVMAVLAALYMFGAYLLGFYISTLLYLPAGMFFLGQRNKTVLVVVSVSLPLFVYVFFELLLTMRIPAGVLFG